MRGVYIESKISYLSFSSDFVLSVLCVNVCVLGGSVLVQRAAFESVAPTARGNLCDRSLAAPTSSVCCGEPAGLRHTGGS